MTSQCCTVKKLPSAWWGLFVTFQNERNPHVAAEAWWRNATMSKYGDMPQWESLLQSLVSEEPQLVNENLVFCPTFFSLTEYFQKCLLSFLIQHLSELPKQSTQQFLVAVKQNIQYVSDNRIQSLFDHFQYNCNLTWNQTFLSNKHFHHVISKENQAELNDILKLAMSAQPYNPFLPSLFADIHQQIPSENERNIDDVISSNQYDSLLKHCPDLTIPESPIIVIHSDASDNASEEEPMEVSVEGATLPQSSRSTEIPVEESTKQPLPMEVPSDRLPPEIEVKASSLKYIWQQGDKLQDLPPELNLFIECSDQQVHQICHMLDVESLPDSSFAVVCKHFSEVGNQMSYANSLVVAKECILPRFVMQSKQNSRHVVSAVVTFSQQFPKPFVDGVIIPCAEAKKIDIPQAKLMTTVSKDAFTTNTRLYLLEQLSKSCPPIEPGILLLLENLLDGKLELSPDQLSQILQWLKKVTTSEHHSNTKFGRFFITFLKKHNKQLETEHINDINQIVKQHKTPLKNALINMLKDLSK